MIRGIMRTALLPVFCGALLAGGVHAQTTTTFGGGSATSAPTVGDYRGDQGTVYDSVAFRTLSAPTFAGVYGDASFGAFQAIDPSQNGGNFYHGTDGANITLRLLYENIDLTGINLGGGGLGVFGVRNIGATDLNTSLPGHAGLRVFDQTGASPDTERSYIWQAYQNTTQGPDSGWNRGPIGGGVGNPEYDTFDAILEFAPQADNTVHMYMFQRKHQSLNDIAAGGPDDNGTMIWRPHHFGWNGVNRFYNVSASPFFTDVHVYAGVINLRGAPAGGNRVEWGTITAFGTTTTGAGGQNVIPEPGTVALLAVGLPLLAQRIRRRAAST